MKLYCLGLLALLAAVLAAAPRLEAAVTCSSVYRSLEPCLGYIGGAPLDPACCPGIRSVAGNAKTKPDRQSVCGCLKSLAATYTSRIPRANQLLKTCGITINFPLSPNVDCSRVN